MSTPWYTYIRGRWIKKYTSDCPKLEPNLTRKSNRVEPGQINGQIGLTSWLYSGPVSQSCQNWWDAMDRNPEWQLSKQLNKRLQGLGSMQGLGSISQYWDLTLINIECKPYLTFKRYYIPLNLKEIFSSKFLFCCIPLFIKHGPKFTRISP